LNFRQLNIPSGLNTSDHNLSVDFFVPLLSAATAYDRGVGYFSSGWLRINSAGLVDFCKNGGKARWITSPILSEADWNALKSGESGRHDVVIREALRRNISQLEQTLEQDTLSALAWMVADNILTFRLAVLRGKLDGEFHDKFGLFIDADGNQLSFNGSYNESIQGTRNYESFKVFKSWVPDQNEWVKSDATRFNRLWNNEDPNVRVLDIGDANKNNIINLRHSSARPYSVNVQDEGTLVNEADGPAKTKIQLHDYQEKAISAWFANECRGFFVMATGSGKTFTALAATKRLQDEQKKLAVIIAVPYQHLIDQWVKEAQKFGFSGIKAYKSKNLWLEKFNKQIIDFNNGYRNELFVFTTHDTFADTDFQASIQRLTLPSLLIADEAHHLGTEAAQKAYPQHIKYRLGLSATPERWYDDDGTRALKEFFGPTVFEFPLSEAIGISLTPYYYYPVLVELTPEEFDEYQNFTLRIARLMGKEKSKKDEENLKLLLLKRSDVLNKASNKLKVLEELLDKQDTITHTLFFCAPGQLQQVIRLVGRKKGIRVHSFTSEEDNETRQQLLADFADGTLQSLAAIRCLDEGVDVPSTETAYLLASSSNPREFIQRRGRILRKSPNKEFSFLYDLITVPPTISKDSENESVFNLERKIMSKELMRFKEFADYARNKHEAISVIRDIAHRYHLMDF
jgi:superfamily II DNA or RNA helicase